MCWNLDRSDFLVRDEGRGTRALTGVNCGQTRVVFCFSTRAEVVGDEKVVNRRANRSLCYQHHHPISAPSGTLTHHRHQLQVMTSARASNAVATHTNNLARLARPTTTTTTNLANPGCLFRGDGKAHEAFKQLNRVFDGAQVVFHSVVHLGSTRTARVIKRRHVHLHFAQIESQLRSVANFENKLFGWLEIEKQREQRGKQPRTAKARY